jgi:nucleotide-binding universal stress UspA family protein
MAAERIVVGVDGSEGADSAVRWCARYARTLDAEVTAVAVVEPNVPLVPPPDTYAEAMQQAQDAEREKAHATLERDWCRPLRDAGIRYEARSVLGDPAETLMQTAIDLGADLLVVGRRGRGRFIEALVGSVPRKLAHYAELPLVIVPSGWERAT